MMMSIGMTATIIHKMPFVMIALAMATNRSGQAARAFASRKARYALGARRERGKLAKNWNVALPVEIFVPTFEGLDTLAIA